MESERILEKNSYWGEEKVFLGKNGYTAQQNEHVLKKKKKEFNNFPKFCYISQFWGFLISLSYRIEIYMMCWPKIRPTNYKLCQKIKLNTSRSIKTNLRCIIRLLRR